VITDVGSFLAWFDGVHRRTVRDVALLPPEAESWRPPIPDTGEGEAGWGFAKIVAHMAESRGYFANAFCGDGWVWDEWPEDVSARETWVPALERSAEELRTRLGDAPDEWLHRRVGLIGDPDRTMSAWRTLTMMAEHEVHHRAQISAYAGLQGWPVAQTFDRTNEWVVAQREAEAAQARGTLQPKTG
jgi:uncharacterized damage-inducible protein DinB